MPCFFINAIKSCGVKRANAERQKWGLADRKFSGLACKLVKLQRPPPEIRIFSASFVAWSINKTDRPRLPASIAHIMPAAPAPIIATFLVNFKASYEMAVNHQ